VTDALLFLHVLSAAALFVSLVVMTAVFVGAPSDRALIATANAGAAVGLIGTVIFGIALALDIDGYSPWDGWIVIALGLWAVIAETGRRAYQQFPPGGQVTPDRVRWHWITVAVTVLLLADMVWKPWA
jgi:hypothetical protein